MPETADSIFDNDSNRLMVPATPPSTAALLAGATAAVHRCCPAAGDNSFKAVDGTWIVAGHGGKETPQQTQHWDCPVLTSTWSMLTFGSFLWSVIGFGKGGGYLWINGELVAVDEFTYLLLPPTTIHAGAAYSGFHSRFFCAVVPDASWLKSAATGRTLTSHATADGKPVQAASAALHDAAAEFLTFARVASTTDHDGDSQLRGWLNKVRSFPVFKRMATAVAAHNNKCPSHFGSW